jgi:hypothetical protein
MANGQHLRHELGSSRERRNWFEGSTEIIGVEAGNNHLFSGGGQLFSHLYKAQIEKLPFVNADHERRIIHRPE